MSSPTKEKEMSAIIGMLRDARICTAAQWYRHFPISYYHYLRKDEIKAVMDMTRKYFVHDLSLYELLVPRETEERILKNKPLPANSFFQVFADNGLFPDKAATLFYRWASGSGLFNLLTLAKNRPSPFRPDVPEMIKQCLLNCTPLSLSYDDMAVQYPRDGPRPDITDVTLLCLNSPWEQGIWRHEPSPHVGYQTTPELKALLTAAVPNPPTEIHERAAKSVPILVSRVLKGHEHITKDEHEVVRSDAELTVTSYHFNLTECRPDIFEFTTAELQEMLVLGKLNNPLVEKARIPKTIHCSNIRSYALKNASLIDLSEIFKETQLKIEKAEKKARAEITNLNPKKTEAPTEIEENFIRREKIRFSGRLAF
ncbi:ORF5 [White sturgeon adenovirus 1]|uniref:ORF5 n=1 Tax=White sturgeon adenovirus 1 TaxID=2580388 RepID=A0A4P8PIQ6_9ADEN|nr:ORF5 [White sturgeon adenovirus 1]QCQ84181.1 ORF5 [White sturgeon adenovirus 1]